MKRTGHAYPMTHGVGHFHHHQVSVLVLVTWLEVDVQRITCPNIKLAAKWAWKNNLSLGGNLGW